MKTQVTSLLLLAIISILCLSLAFSSSHTDTSEFDKNYVHNVYFWLKNPDSSADREAFEKSLKKFLENSKFAKTNYIGVAPKATREVVDDSFTYHLLVTFESSAAQESYQKEPPHLLFIEEASHLWEKVIVYDSKDSVGE